MAFGYFMNMEKLALAIVEKHILNMTNDNYEDDCFLNINALTNNIENGFIILTQLTCYFESFLNTIINSCMNYNGGILLKCSIEEKIEIIFMHYQKELNVIKSNNLWQIYKKSVKVRNEMIHFKKTYIGDGSGLPNFKLGGQEVAEFFTNKNMILVKDGYIKLTNLISAILELSVLNEIDIFECDGINDCVNYVYDSKKINITEINQQENS